MREVIVGWDGGGTATKVVCVSPQGEVLARNRFGALNINGMGQLALEQTVRECVRWMELQGECVSLCIGTAGISNTQMVACLNDALMQYGCRVSPLFVGDHEAALRGAVGTSGLILIAGTGTIAYGRDALGGTARAGGGGYLLDDEGSGYAIGRDILRAVLRAEDGRQKETILQDLVKREIGDASRMGIVEYVYKNGVQKANVAALAKLLDEAAVASDEAACGIVEHAARELCALVCAVVQRLGMKETESALLGGVLENCQAVRGRLENMLSKLPYYIHVIKPKHDAGYGAAMLAIEYAEPKCV